MVGQVWLGLVVRREQEGMYGRKRGSPFPREAMFRPLMSLPSLGFCKEWGEQSEPWGLGQGRDYWNSNCMMGPL